MNNQQIKMYVEGIVNNSKSPRKNISDTEWQQTLISETADKMVSKGFVSSGNKLEQISLNLRQLKA